MFPGKVNAHFFPPQCKASVGVGPHLSQTLASGRSVTVVQSYRFTTIIKPDSSSYNGFRRDFAKYSIKQMQDSRRQIFYYQGKLIKEEQRWERSDENLRLIYLKNPNDLRLDEFCSINTHLNKLSLSKRLTQKDEIWIDNQISKLQWYKYPDDSIQNQVLEFTLEKLSSVKQKSNEYAQFKGVLADIYDRSEFNGDIH